jgi:hypothetical protein
MWLWSEEQPHSGKQFTVEMPAVRCAQTATHPAFRAPLSRGEIINHKKRTSL